MLKSEGPRRLGLGLAGRHTFEIPVRGVPLAMKASAAFPRSSISSSVNGWVHASVLPSKSSFLHTVGPVISLGNSLYGLKAS